MTTLTQIAVPFHNAELYLVEHDGQPYTPMKPIVEGMGLAWQSQLAKLNANPQRWGITKIVIPTLGDLQEMVCLPLRKLLAWLTTISPNKVRPELRDTVIMYQNECDDVLWDYWSKGQAINQRHTITPEQQHELHEIVSSRTGSNVAARMEMWTRHNRHFKISKYHQLLAVHFDDAKNYLETMELKTKNAKDTSLEAIEKPYNIRDFVNVQQNDVMNYVWSLHHQIKLLGGKPTEWPFDEDAIVKGFMGHFLHGKRILLNFTDRNIHVEFVAPNALSCSPQELPEIIEKRESINKSLLTEIINAAVKRLTK